MVKENVKEIQLIRLTYDLADFCRSFEEKQKGWRQVGDELVRDVVVVYNGIDRWDSIIDPKGYVGNPSIVISDYDHNRIQTGAYLTNFRVLDTLEIEGLDGQKQTLTYVLVAEDHIPKTAQCYFWVKGVTQDGQYYRTGQKASNGSMYEQALNNQLNAVSVDFEPMRKFKNKNGEIEDGIVFDPTTGITTYRYWDLKYVSHLDIGAGQQFSGFVRSLETITESINQNIIMSDTTPENTEEIVTDNQPVTDPVVITESETPTTDEVQRANKTVVEGKEKETADEDKKESPTDEANEDQSLHARMAKCESQMSDHSKALNQIRNMLGEPKTRSLDLDSPEVEASFMRKLEEKFEARIIELQTQNLQRMAVPSQKAVASDPIGLDDKDSSAGSESKTQLDDLTPEAYAMELYRTQNLNN